MAEYKSLQELQKHPVFKEFLEICRVPRKSYHEEKISAYLLEWAKAHGLWAVQDKNKNVLMRKPASKGYEEAPGLILQAHMDMVCEKAPGVVHDFSKDPIVPVLEGDLLTTGGRTTLGADDGMGMALALGILGEENLEHPALEGVFTTAEEEDLSGALGFDSKSLEGSYFLNLDHASDQEILCGSCQGAGMRLHIPAVYEPCKEGKRYYKLSIENLPGGHSGEDIHRGNGSANQLLGRILYALVHKAGCGICGLKGGSFRLAIPRDAEAVVCVSPENAGKAQEVLEQGLGEISLEYEGIAPERKFVWEETGAVPEQLSRESAEKFFYALFLSPDGIWNMNGAVPGVVESSDNLGELHLDKKEFTFVYEIRTSFDSTLEYLAEKISLLGKLLGGTTERFSEYPGWRFKPHSRFREKAAEVYKQEFGEEPKITVVHAGLECGCFFPGKPSLDALSIGPNAWDFHSPHERVSISSVEKVYEFMKKLTESLAE